MWFGMAGLDYERGSVFPFTTAGWFILSQIFTIPIFACVVWPIELLFARWRRVIGVLVFASMTALLGMAIHDALPQQRLSWLIGPDLMQHAEIERLHVTDSFGDGDTYNGTLLVGPEFVGALESNPDFASLKRHPDEYVRPDKAGTVYRSKRAELRIVPDGSKCFFKSSFENNPEQPRKPNL